VGEAASSKSDGLVGLFVVESGTGVCLSVVGERLFGVSVFQ
jgi:hypothetical protein